jgi:hypothetical protein
VARWGASAIDVWDRVVNRVELRRSGPWRSRGDDLAVAIDRALAGAGAELGRDLVGFAAEPRLAATEAAISSPGTRSHSAYYDAPGTLRRLCYLLCRALDPDVVVETGVANGGTSAYLLAALDENGRGRLHSIDWMPGGPRQRRPVGDLVPDDLRARWELEWGPSRRLLSRLLRRVDPPSLFVHDSDHTRLNMRRELDTIAPALRRPGAVLVDDVQLNESFDAWVRDVRPAYSARIAAEEGHAVGLAVWGTFDRCAG